MRYAYTDIIDQKYKQYRAQDWKIYLDYWWLKNLETPNMLGFGTCVICLRC